MAAVCYGPNFQQKYLIAHLDSILHAQWNYVYPGNWRQDGMKNGDSLIAVKPALPEVQKLLLF